MLFEFLIYPVKFIVCLWKPFLQLVDVKRGSDSCNNVFSLRIDKAFSKELINLDSVKHFVDPESIKERLRK